MTRQIIRKRYLCVAGITAVLGSAGCALEAGEGLGMSAQALDTTFTFGENAAITSKEHCQLPSPHGANLEGRQVRIEASGGHVGLCTVIGNSADSKAYMNATGLHKRLGRDENAASTVTVTGVTVSDICPSGSASCNGGIADPVTDLADTYGISGVGPTINEYAKETGTYSKVAYTAPHSGIEKGTGQQIQAIYDEELARNGAVYQAYWSVGYKSGSGMDHHDHYHITSTDMSEDSFIGLDALLALSGVRQAVSFHGCGSSCGTFDVNIGGGIDVSWRRGVADLLRGMAEKEGRTFTVTPTPPSGIDGDHQDNFVNRLTATSGRGLQIEQSLTVRDSATDRELVALTVKEALDCVRENSDSYASVDDTLTVVSRDAGSTYYDGGNGQCDGYGVQYTFSNTGTLNDVSFQAELSSSVACTSGIDGARVFANIYRQNASGDWDRVGGGWRDIEYQNLDGTCTYTADTFYEPVTLDVPAGTTRFRIVARAHDASGQVLAVRSSVSKP